jgi:hypothetical protein
LTGVHGLLPVCVVSSFGCFYANLDTESLDAKAAGRVASSDSRPDAGRVSSPTTGAGGYTTALETPPIELANGTTTTDPCVQTTAQATAILTQDCAPCHAPPGNAANFHSILDFARLVTLRSSTQKDPYTGEYVRLVVPGDPDRSRVYLRISAGEMPPTFDASLPQLPRPTFSDLSLLRTWIQSCLGSDPLAPTSADAGTP